MEKQSSLVKAFRILEALARKRLSTISEIAVATGYPASTVHRILAVMLDMGYVRKNYKDRSYHLGLKLLQFSARLSENLDIATVARPTMLEIMEKTRETVNLVVFEGDEAIYVDQVNNTRSLLRMFTKVGARVPLYCSGVGKAYLATLDTDQIHSYLRRVEMVPLTKHTIITGSKLLNEIEKIKAQGYARDREEIETGVACVSALIYHGECVAGGISISGPSSRINNRVISDLGNRVMEAAGAISSKLSQWGNPILFSSSQ